MLLVLTGIGALYAVAVWFLIGSDLIWGGSLGQMRLVLMGVHAAYFVIGGGILLVATLLVTHRYAGPALVMERAVDSMRRGEYDTRLSTRAGDFHKDLTLKLRHLRDELREREDARTTLLTELEACLEQGDIAGGRARAEELRKGPTASTAKAAQETAAV